MIAGSRACSTFSPATQPNITNQTSPHYAETLGRGNVNRIKTLKRQMYGRAKFDLLRKRVLLA